MGGPTRGPGFSNELETSLEGIDEVEFYETVRNDFSSYPYIPQFVLGHTHGPWRTH